ncbi:MAG: hypothetical protein GXC78_05635 [Chitinophagaceae bacterium]|nr:hypothetical protein [Chitinophagaceae bacterium]
MSYQIIDTGASIRFISDDGFFYLMKHQIKSIQTIRENIVRIDTGGGCCMHSIFIQVESVISPPISGTEQLMQLLNEWTSDFLQGYPDPPDPGPIE